ncbi:hypothetical protein DW094_08465 [Ruminococcaceae bacterium AM07-15]|nr:hypothetical protein DW094_08465 [Ruminococcaceae bacterium AM07-15]
MADNFFKGFDLSYSTDLATHSATQFAERERVTRQIAQEAYQNRQKMQKALEATAENTARTNQQLQQVVQNQNDYIALLKQQLETDEQQLDVLKSIFASDENGAAVEKEILNLIRDQIDSQHPMWDYVKDKTGDIAVAGITAGAPIIYNALKAYLATKGVLLP